MDTISISILQVIKVRHREAKQLGHGHTAVTADGGSSCRQPGSRACTCNHLLPVSSLSLFFVHPTHCSSVQLDSSPTSALDLNLPIPVLAARARLFALEAHLLCETIPRSSLMCTCVGSLPLDSKVVIRAQVSCPLLAWRHLLPGVVSGMSRHPRPEHPGQSTTRVLPGWRGGEPSTKGPPTSARTAQRLQLEPPPGGILPAGLL